MATHNLSRSRDPWLAALVATVLFVPTITFSFVLDDKLQVDEALLRQADALWHIVSSPTPPGDLYRPLVTLSYWLTYLIAGIGPAAFHLTNVLLHAGVSALVVKTLAPLLGRAAFFAGLLFAVHPVHVEAVACVANRTELFAAFLGLLSVNLLRSALQADHAMFLRRLALSCLCFLMALLSKESAVTILLLAPALLWTEKRRPVRPNAIGWTGAALTSTLLVAFFLRLTVLGAMFGRGQPVTQLDNALVLLAPFDRLRSAFALLGDYLVLSVIPWPLSADYSYAKIVPEHGLLGPAGTFVAILVAVALGLAAFLTYRRSVAGFLILWFFAAFAATANVWFPIGTIFADRLLYLPSVGICGLLASRLAQLATPVRRFLGLVLCGVWFLNSLVYSLAWSDEEVLFQREMRFSSDSAKVNVWYGNLLKARGDRSGARIAYRTALYYYPGIYHASYGLAALAIEEGDTNAARTLIEAGLAKDPNKLHGLNLLGSVELRRGEYDKAGEIFAHVLSIDNFDTDAKIGLLAVLVARNRREQALELLQELKNEAPNHPQLPRFRAWAEQAPKS